MEKIVLGAEVFGKPALLLIGEYTENPQNTDIVHILGQFPPFRCTVGKKGVECYNIEDFLTLKHVRKKIEIIGEVPFGKLSLHSPKLYIQRGGQFFPFLSTISSPFIHCKILATDKLGIILPINCPVDRGNVCEQMIYHCPRTILVSGGAYGDNRDSTAILTLRVLLKKGFPKDRIIKNMFSSDLYDIIDILDLACGKKDLLIGCDYSTMISIKGVVRKRKVSYLCPYP